MTDSNVPSKRASHSEMLRDAWDGYKEAYMDFNLKEVPGSEGRRVGNLATKERLEDPKFGSNVEAHMRLSTSYILRCTKPKL